jgi:hypothetical protein
VVDGGDHAPSLDVAVQYVEMESKFWNQEITFNIQGFKGWVTWRFQALWVNCIQLVQPHLGRDDVEGDENELRDTKDFVAHGVEEGAEVAIVLHAAL